MVSNRRLLCVLPTVFLYGASIFACAEDPKRKIDLNEEFSKLLDNLHEIKFSVDSAEHFAKTLDNFHNLVRDDNSDNFSTTSCDSGELEEALAAAYEWLSPLFLNALESSMHSDFAVSEDVKKHLIMAISQSPATDFETVSFMLRRFPEYATLFSVKEQHQILENLSDQYTVSLKSMDEIASLLPEDDNFSAKKGFFLGSLVANDFYIASTQQSLNLLKVAASLQGDGSWWIVLGLAKSIRYHNEELMTAVLAYCHQHISDLEKSKLKHLIIRNVYVAVHDASILQARAFKLLQLLSKAEVLALVKLSGSNHRSEEVDTSKLDFECALTQKKPYVVHFSDKEAASFISMALKWPSAGEAEQRRELIQHVYSRNRGNSLFVLLTKAEFEEFKTIVDEPDLLRRVL